MFIYRALQKANTKGTDKTPFVVDMQQLQFFGNKAHMLLLTLTQYRNNFSVNLEQNIVMTFRRDIQDLISTNFSAKREPTFLNTHST